MNMPVYPIEVAFPEVVAAAHETALGVLVDVADRGLEFAETFVNLLGGYQLNLQRPIPPFDWTIDFYFKSAAQGQMWRIFNDPRSFG